MGYEGFIFLIKYNISLMEEDYKTKAYNVYNPKNTKVQDKI